MMLWRNMVRCSTCVKTNEFSCDNSRPKANILKFATDYAKAFAITASSIFLCVGLINNELKKLRRNIKSLHDIFDFEKKTDSYVSVPNYTGDSAELSSLKKFVKELKKDRSVWEALPTRTLLKCVRSKDIIIQQRALNILSAKRFSEDIDYWIISQSIDLSTSLHLARIENIDTRFFRKPVNLPPSNQSLEIELTNIIDAMPKKENIKNHQQFIDNIRKRKIYASSHIDKTVMLGFETFDESSVCTDSRTTLDYLIIIHLLQAVLWYSEITANCTYLVEKGILCKLRRVYERCSDDTFITELLCRILNNILVAGASPQALFETGWFNLIVHWTRSQNHSLFLSSVKLLANMDLSINNVLGQFYDNRVCLLHPIYHQREPIEVDVVFIHGMQGGPMKTWRQRDRKRNNNNKSNINDCNSSSNNKNSSSSNNNKPNNNKFVAAENGNVFHITQKDAADLKNNKESKCSPSNNSNINNNKHYNSNNNKNGTTIANNNNNSDNVYIFDDEEDCEENSSSCYTQCWPKDWLPQDLPNLRVLSVEYNTQLTRWTYNNQLERKTLREQAEILLDSLVAVDLGKRPVVFVGHSMGGLLIKQMLCLSAERRIDLTNQVKGVVFYSVPHRGSYLVNRTRNASYLLHPTEAVLQLAEGSSDLRDLHSKFLDLAAEKSIKMISLTEGASTNLPFNLKATVVPQHSSDPGFGDFYVMKDHDHVTICKPRSKNSSVYMLTKDFIRYCLKE